jgi:ribonuclease-3
LNRRASAVAALEARLGHRFADRALLERALTHSSVGAGPRKPPDNERLEFLGDRVLGLIMAHHLLADDEDASAGDLSKRFHRLVSGESCAKVARALGLGEALRLPEGETRRGARDHDTLLADGCEAIIAALYLELGFGETAKRVLTLWRPVLEEPHDPSLVNPKSELQEWAAATGRSPPVYRLLAREGPDHQPIFTAEVSIDGAEPQTARGNSLRNAEKAAALTLLKRERGQT